LAQQEGPGVKDDHQQELLTVRAKRPVCIGTHGITNCATAIATLTFWRPHAGPRGRAGVRSLGEEVAMRRRLAFVSTLIALVLVLALPGTTLGATFTYSIQSNTCSASGGKYGYGHLYFKVQLKEYGWSGANKFTFNAKVQHRSLGSSRWVVDANDGTRTYRFTNNGANTTYARWYSYDPHDNGWHRFKVVLKVWKGTRLLAKKTVYGKTC
jgi:hypothetical protein